MAIQLAEHGPNLTHEGLSIGSRSSAKMLKNVCGILNDQFSVKCIKIGLC